MRDSSPILMRRILALRQFPLFVHADFDELAIFAENVVERSFAVDDVVAPAERLPYLHLVLEGHVEYGQTQIGPKQVHGALEVLANRPARLPAIARAPTRTLAIRSSDFLEVLEDNFGLLLATVRDLAARVIPLRLGRRVLPALAGNARLGLVERIIALRRHLPFAAARLEALAILAHAAREVRWPAGAIVREAETIADTALLVVDGSVCNEQGDEIAAIGAIEALAGGPHTSSYTAITPVCALEIQLGTILDVLEDHTDFALALMQAFARALLAEELRIACAPGGSSAGLARDPAPRDSTSWRDS